MALIWFVFKTDNFPVNNFLFPFLFFLYLFFYFQQFSLKLSYKSSQFTTRWLCITSYIYIIITPFWLRFLNHSTWDHALYVMYCVTPHMFIPCMLHIEPFLGSLHTSTTSLPQPHFSYAVKLSTKTRTTVFRDYHKEIFLQFNFGCNFHRHFKDERIVDKKCHNVDKGVFI